VYKLKRLYGVTVTLVKPYNTVTDFQTGQVVKDSDTLKIRGVLTQGRNIFEESNIKANFNYGGLIHTTTKLLILDARDLIKFGPPKISWAVICKDVRYVIKSIDQTEDQSAYLLTLKASE
jgi:hypothetical protein